MMQEKCQFLERKGFKKLEGMDGAKRIAELERKLTLIMKEKN